MTEVFPLVTINVSSEVSYEFLEITGIDTGDAPKNTFGQDEYIYK